MLTTVCLISVLRRSCTGYLLLTREENVLFKLQEKPLRNLTWLVMPAFEMLQLPDLSLQFEGGLPEEVTAELASIETVVEGFRNLHTRTAFGCNTETTSLTALGMTEHEVLGTQFLLDAHNMQLMPLAEPSDL